MLRGLAVLFLVIGAAEAVLIALGTLPLAPGLGAICFALFFAGVLEGMSGIQRRIEALGDQGRVTAQRSTPELAATPKPKALHD